MTTRSLILHGGLLTLLGTGVRTAQAQRAPMAEPAGPFRLRMVDSYLQLDAEGERETQGAGSAGGAITRERVLLQSTVGVDLQGSVYHPDLLNYQLNPELGADWQSSRLNPGREASDLQFLQRYHASLNILQQKPYATRFFADKDLTYRDYDFFSRVRVDSERFGGRSGYSEGPVPFTISFQHYGESESESFRPTSMTDDTLSFSARNMRASGKGSTQLNYDVDQFFRQDTGYSSQHGLHQNLSVFDSEIFGAKNWGRLNSVLNFNSISETVQPTDKVMIQETLHLQHTPQLRSFYEYAYDTASAGGAQTDGHQGRVGLNHQLGDTLASTLDAHGNTTSGQSPGATSDSSRYGFSLSEQYTQPLGEWGDLTLGYQGTFDREERLDTGQLVNVIDESRTLSDATLTFLSMPSVVRSSIRVTDKTGTLTYTEGFDYRIVDQGAMVEIQRLPGGRIPDGGAVLVSYAAQLQPSVSYYSSDKTGFFRLSLWKGLFDLYGRWANLGFSGVHYSAQEQPLLRWLDDKTVGVDSTWPRAHFGAEYEVADSNLAPYDRVRLFQSAKIQLTDGGSLGVDLDQNWTTFRDTQSHQTSYGFIVRFQQVLTANLVWTVEGGVRTERGQTFDRDLATARTGLDWTIGKLAVKVGYSYGNEAYPTDARERHFVFLRARRSF